MPAKAGCAAGLHILGDETATGHFARRGIVLCLNAARSPGATRRDFPKNVLNADQASRSTEKRLVIAIEGGVPPNHEVDRRDPVSREASNLRTETMRTIQTSGLGRPNKMAIGLHDVHPKVLCEVVRRYGTNVGERAQALRTLLDQRGLDLVEARISNVLSDRGNCLDLPSVAEHA